MCSTLFGTCPCHHYTTNIKLDLNGNVIIALISKMVPSSMLTIVAPILSETPIQRLICDI